MARYTRLTMDEREEISRGMDRRGQIPKMISMDERLAEVRLLAR